MPDPGLPDVLARSAIRPPDPVTVVAGWEVSAVRSYAPLRLVDLTPLSTVLVRAAPDGAVASRLGVPLGSARRDEHATLVVGSGPGEWLLIAAPGRAAEVARRIDPTDDRLVTVQDFTHGRVLVQLTGAAAADALSKLCAVDLGDRATPDGTAFRSAVARVVTDVVREDVDGTRSYLLHCERSVGQYLFDVLLDAGREFGVEPDGFPADRAS